MERNAADEQGMCGIAKAASYPIKKHDNPKNLPEICGWYADCLNSKPVQISCAICMMVLCAAQLSTRYANDKLHPGDTSHVAI